MTKQLEMANQWENTRNNKRKQGTQKRHEFIKIGNQDGQCDNKGGGQYHTNKIDNMFSPRGFREPVLDRVISGQANLPTKDNRI